MSLVEIRDVSKSYGAVPVLKGVSLDIAAGEVVAVIGRSGSGKSTLLRCVNGLEPIQAGAITVDGVKVNDPATNLRKLRQQVGIVFQQFNLFPHLDAVRNVMCGLTTVHRTPHKEARERAVTMLERVGLGAHAHKYPSELSGGQQQRVAIARALVKEPEVLLADEPTGALDEATRDEILELLEGIRRDRGLTLVIVTHDSAVARRAERRLHLRDGVVTEGGR